MMEGLSGFKQTMEESIDSTRIVNLYSLIQNEAGPLEPLSLYSESNSNSLAGSVFKASPEARTNMNRSMSVCSPSPRLNGKQRKTGSRLSASRSLASFRELPNIFRKSSFVGKRPSFAQKQCGAKRRDGSRTVLSHQASTFFCENDELRERVSRQIVQQCSHVSEEDQSELYNLVVDISKHSDDEEKVENDFNVSDDRAVSERPTSSDPIPSVLRNEPKKRRTFSVAYPLCLECGSKHRLSEHHDYEYVKEADDDLLCDICMQPFVEPYDTKCGHTFCCVCLKNYVRLKRMCPVDRTELKFASSDCWRSSVVMRRLVNKLEVRCPNTKHCQMTLQRANLESHLKERCPGALVRCKYVMFGCGFRAPRVEHHDHEKLCRFHGIKGNPLDLLYPSCDKHTVELFRSDGNADLGLVVVGGNDTPIRSIVVQRILPFTLTESDGRIQPGDVIVDVNGEAFHNISHVEARAAISKHRRLVRFTLMRERIAEMDSDLLHDGEAVRIPIVITKAPNEQLGIKLASNDRSTPGVYVQEVLPGRVAYQSGLLQEGDRILQVAKADMSKASVEVAARAIQNSGEKIEMTVCRMQERSLQTIENPWASGQVFVKDLGKETQPFRAPIPEVLPMNTSYLRKVVSLAKDSNESLGIIISGGIKCDQGNLPIFVEDIRPSGVLGRDGRIRRGDLLVHINGVSLRSITRQQAIEAIKASAHNCERVTIVAIELDYNGKEEDFAFWEELSGVLHHDVSLQQAHQELNPWLGWTLSWKFWLAVPPQNILSREVVLKKNVFYELGFSIASDGRPQNEEQNRRVFVRYVAPRSPAVVQGRLNCGDEISAINGRHVTTMTHRQVIEELKTKSTVKLTVVSWPGSVH